LWMSEQAKTCSKCGELKLLAFFNKQKQGKYGVNSICKKCQAAWASAYRKENPEKFRENEKRYRKENKEKIRSYKKIYHKENSEKCRDLYKRWRDKNPDKSAAKSKMCRDKLHDFYVIDKIKRGTGLTASEIPQELIELKRIQLKITRELRK
jgi:hypothetical protein